MHPVGQIPGKQEGISRTWQDGLEVRLPLELYGTSIFRHLDVEYRCPFARAVAVPSVFVAGCAAVEPPLLDLPVTYCLLHPGIGSIKPSSYRNNQEINTPLTRKDLD